MSGTVVRNFEIKDLASRQSRFIIALVAAILAIAAVVLRLSLWRYDLRVPITYNGDALFELVYIKPLTEHVWNNYIPELGAPFGVDAVDWPVGRSLDYALMKLLSLVVRDPFLLVNVFWLLTIAFDGAFAALFFRYLRIRRLWAVLFGTLYAIIPFTFYRNIGHLCLTHFIVPGAAYLAVSVAEGKTLFFRTRDTSLRPDTAINVWVAVAACLAAGLTFPYWAFFSCILIAIGCVIGFARTKSKSVLFTALVFIVLIGCAKVADVTPTLVHWYRHGQSTALNYRSEAEADIYGLTIRQMFTPITGHPFRPLLLVRDKIFAAGFPHDQNESSAANLGMISAIGFVVLLIVAIAHPRGKILGDNRIQIFAGCVVGLVLIAGVGGFGSLFNVFVIRTFRCYNRVSPFISLLSLGTVAIVYDKVFCRNRPHFEYLMAVLTLGFGTMDQIPGGLANARDRDRQRFHNDHHSIATLESRLAPGSMVFELPDSSIPEVARYGKMDIYDNARPYLHSKTLRWSWGALLGRHHDWAQKTASLKPPDMVERLAWAGFSGILLDRAGYSDKTLERELGTLLESSAKVETRGRWVFFDIREFRAKLISGLSQSDIVREEKAATDPISFTRYRLGSHIYFGQGGDSDRFKVRGWSGTEPEFTWTEGKSAVLQFTNVPPGHPLILKVTANALTFDPIVVHANGQKVAKWQITSAVGEHTASIPMGVVDNTKRLQIEFWFSKPVSPKSIGLNADTRILGLCVFDLVLQEGAVEDSHPR
jgi:phosphoglycerol transferase